MPPWDTDAILRLEVRRNIYNAISESPGIHFRELQRRQGIAYGALQYHLTFLLKNNLIEEEKAKDSSRFFSAGFKSMMERELVSLLRQKTIRHILIYILENPGSRNKDASNNLNHSPSTVSWHIKRLILAGALRKETRESITHFYVTEPEAITRLLITYRPSFLDDIVDRFVEVWEKKPVNTTR